MAAHIKEMMASPLQDPNERRELSEAARDLYMSLETPLDTMHRLFWSIEQLPVVQVGVDLKLFRTLATDPQRPWPVDELAQQVGAEATLLSRLLRYLRSFGLVRELPNGTYAANGTTCWLATPGAEGGVKHYNVTVTKILGSLPAFLANNGYRNPTDPANCAFNLAWGYDKPAYSGWVPPDPTLLPAFMEFMKSQRGTQKSCMTSFPVEKLRLSPEDVEKERALFVDVGGSAGHQCLNLRQTHPELKGRIILEDQASVISALDHNQLTSQGIQPTAHDFFTPQPTPAQGARAFYLRNIMHDWPDDKCIEILQHLKDAMADDSMILIDEMVLPDTGASWKQAQKDIQMMAGLAAMERSTSQWKELARRAGLRIEDVVVYDEEMGDSIIVLRK